MIEAWAPAVLVVVSGTAYLLGQKDGRRRERNRAIQVCTEVLNQHYSGSVRWALQAIASGAAEPMPREKFFPNPRPEGPPCPPTPPVLTDRDP